VTPALSVRRVAHRMKIHARPFVAAMAGREIGTGTFVGTDPAVSASSPAPTWRRSSRILGDGKPSRPAAVGQRLDLDRPRLGGDDVRRDASHDLPCRLAAGDVAAEAEFAVTVEHRHVAVRPHVDRPRALGVLDHPTSEEC
jgi:hypothetical protein